MIINRYPWKAAYFDLNNKGRDFVAGDIHGEFEFLQQSLSRLNFDYKIDRLFCVGDLIDRGLHSPRVSEFLAYNWFNSIAGNHEWMLYNSHDNNKLKMQLWYPNGGDWWKTISLVDQSNITSSIESQLYSSITINTKYRQVGLVHALTYPFYNWGQFCQKLEYDQIIQQWALWERDFEAFQHKIIADIDLILCGHTPVEKPFSFSNFINLDTGCGHHACHWLAEPALTIVELASELEFHRFSNKSN